MTPYHTGRRTFLKEAGVLGAGTVGFAGTVAASSQAEYPVVIDEPGTFRLSEDVAVDSDQAGSEETPHFHVTADDVVFDGGGHAISYGLDTGVLVTADDVTVRNLRLGCPLGIRLRDASNCYVENVEFDTEVGIRMDAAVDSTIESSRFDVAYDSISMRDSDYNRIADCEFEQERGIHADSCHRNEVRDCSFDGLTEPLLFVDSNENVVAGNTITSPESMGVHLTRCYAMTVHANRIDASETRDGVYAVDSRRTVVTSNTVTDCARSGIRLTRSDDSVVTGNSISENAGVAGDGVTLNDSDDVVLTANDIADFGSENVEIEGGSEDTVLVGNGQ